MTLAIYPGSFDPITHGHIDVALRAARIFDNLVLAVYRESDKPGAMFSIDERIELAREAVKVAPNITVDSFSGLTVDYARALGANTIVRGLRAVSDFEYEFKLAHMNDHLAPEIEVCLLDDLVSTFIHQLEFDSRSGDSGGDVNGLVPDHVREAIRAKVATRSGAGAAQI